MVVAISTTEQEGTEIESRMVQKGEKKKNDGGCWLPWSYLDYARHFQRREGSGVGREVSVVSYWLVVLEPPKQMIYRSHL